MTNAVTSAAAAALTTRAIGKVLQSALANARCDSVSVRPDSPASRIRSANSVGARIANVSTSAAMTTMTTSA